MASKPANNLVLYDPDEQSERRKAYETMQDAVRAHLYELGRQAADAVTRRGMIEQRWLANLRQIHGQYDDATMRVLRDDDSRSQVFINITRPKTNAWKARLGDMLFPNDERNWGIDPTPVPTLDAETRALAKQIDEKRRAAEGLVAQHNAQVDASGGQPVPSDVPTQAQAMLDEVDALQQRDREVQATIELAQQRAKNMQRLIDDQFTESQYPARCRDVIDDMCEVGVGILKGPMVNDRPRKRWQAVAQDQTAMGSGTIIPEVYRLETEADPAPIYRRVNYWHFFPDPDAETMDDCGYTFERHLPNKKKLRQMARDHGFYPPAVARLLKEGAGATIGAGMPDLNFFAELRSLEVAQGVKAVNGLDPLRERYLIWEYHGPLELDAIVDMLHATGRAKDAERICEQTALEVPMVRIFFAGDLLLKIEEDYLLDSGASLYSVATFEKGDSCVMGGVGVAQLMANEQAMLNGAIRMMLDNAALAVGPQVVIDKEAIEPENGRWKLTPRKVWQWVTSATGLKREVPFATFNIPMNQEMLAAIVQLALRFTDEAVSMPLIAQGEMGAHVTKTSSGMSMLFNSANVVFRRVVKNWDDDITAPVVSRSYDFNMQFSPDPDVKGDMKIEARGTSVLLVRELQAEQLTAIIDKWSSHPIIGVGFRAYHAMRLVLQAMNINPEDLLLPEDDYLEKLKAMSEAEDQNPDAIRAQASIQVAQIDAESRLAVVEGNKEIARLNQATAFAKLAQDKEISLEQIKAMFQATVVSEANRAEIEKGKRDSDERKLAVEIGVEDRNARRAEAMGMEPTGSGGAISMGAEKRA